MTTNEDSRMHKYMTVEMPDGSKWGVPVAMIARSRAAHYAREFGGDVELSLAEDTIPLFEAEDYAIEDWAKNNMNWSDFDGHQIKVAIAPQPDFQKAWMNGATGFIKLVDDCPHAAPFRYCPECVVSPCPVGLGKEQNG